MRSLISSATRSRALDLAGGQLAVAELVAEYLFVDRSMSGFGWAGSAGNCFGSRPAVVRSSSIMSMTLTICWWANENRLEHVVFGHFAGEAFDHGDGLAGAGHDQVEIAFLQSVKGGHDDEFAVDPADANGAGQLE